MGAGYANPANIQVSPGQIITIFVTGLNPDFSQPQRATSTPLPTSLAGISVSINQGSQNPAVPVPLLSVDQIDNTLQPAAAPSDSMIVAITLQIPYELSPDQTLAAPSTKLVITTTNVVSTFSVLALTDALHVLNTCDAFPSKGLSGGPANGSSPCSPTVTHADGTLVTADAPAKPGETVVIYAFGLGQTIPAVRSGDVSPTPAPILGSGQPNNPLRTLTLEFDFRPNAGPSKPYILPPPLNTPIPVPRFAGLTPGQVGLYQINVQLPSTFPTLRPCTPPALCPDNSVTCPSAIRSNLTIDIGGVNSFGGAAICVQAQ